VLLLLLLLLLLLVAAAASPTGRTVRQLQSNAR